METDLLDVHYQQLLDQPEVLASRHLNWIQRYGSQRLKDCQRYGYDTAGLYAQEWVAQQLPQWQVDIEANLKWQRAARPSELAFLLLEAHQKRFSQLDPRDFPDGLNPTIAHVRCSHTGLELGTPGLEALVQPFLAHYTLVRYLPRSSLRVVPDSPEPLSTST
ncbi:MAG: hypothetical protein AAGF24_06535 [Cyanobacteria bacterium P01_H01_bin.121]